MEHVVLCYIEKDDKYLMLLRNKRKVDMNKGKYVGVGGHIEKGETKEEAMIREVYEETGLKVKDYTYRGQIHYYNKDFLEIMYLFHATTYDGEIIECDEGTLSWVNKKNVLSLNLWEGDKYFLIPFMETDEEINLKMVYDGDKLLSWEKL